MRHANHASELVVLLAAIGLPLGFTAGLSFAAAIICRKADR